MTTEIFREMNEAGLTEDVRATVQRFLELDFFQQSQAQTLELLKNKNVAEIERLFLHRLEFGTAGLRAEMGCGFSRMNDVTVMQTTHGVALHLQKFFCEDPDACSKLGVVIGFDGRHNSMRFAHIAAAMFLAFNFKVYLFKNYSPTPTNPFSILRYSCLAGIQITASHNPKKDNGYKLYAHNGAQIIPPSDTIISALIENNESGDFAYPKMINSALEYLDAKTGMLNESALRSILLVRPDDDVRQAYMAATEILCTKKEEIKKSEVKVVYTAMHGVGYGYVAEIMGRIGFNNLCSVKEQQDADPEFPTVTFPNPEEPGALSLATKYADTIGSPMVIANDPDADRFACAEKGENGWRVFKGDEIGILFGYRLFELALARGIPREKMLFICSAVSSRMLEKMAVTEGCVFEETMTGFKWMMNLALEKAVDLVPIFTYEEALGYAVSMQVPDKDGISSAAIWVELVCELYNKGMTVAKLLDSLCKKYGYFVSYNNYFKFTDKKWMTDTFTKFRNGGKYPTEIGGYKIKRIRDATTGYDDQNLDKKCKFPLTPDAQMVTLYFENGTVLTIRCSGTEPKLKYYSEISGPDPQKAEVELKTLVKSVISSLFGVANS